MSKFKEKNIIIFGDSITFGEWDSKGGWATRLKNHFFEQRIKSRCITYTQILGIKSETSDDLLKRLKTETETRLLPNVETIFIIAIGVNDTRVDKLSKKVFNTKEKYIQNIQQIIENLNSYDYSQIIFIPPTPIKDSEVEKTSNILDWPVYFCDKISSEFRIELDNYIKYLNSSKINFLNPSDKFYSFGLDKVLEDGLHPNDLGHQIIYEQALKLLKATL